MRSIWILSGLIGLVVLPGCDDEIDVRDIEGTFRIIWSEVLDTCDQILNNGASQLMIDRDGNDVTVRFGEEATLTGTVDSQGLISVSGVISDLGEGRITFMEMTAIVRRPRIEGDATLTFNGTFPEFPGMCEQQLAISGDVVDNNFVPVLPTAPPGDS